MQTASSIQSLPEVVEMCLPVRLTTARDEIGTEAFLRKMSVILSHQQLSRGAISSVIKQHPRIAPLPSHVGMVGLTMAVKILGQKEKDTRMKANTTHTCAPSDGLSISGCKVAFFRNFVKTHPSFIQGTQRSSA